MSLPHKSHPLPPAKRRPTVRDIAKEVGLHFTTVAEALRDSPRVKAETRERVAAAAKKLGYRVDPMLSALSAYRSSKRQPVYQGTLAWINCFDDRHYFSNRNGFYGDCYRGACLRSEDLGYRIEPFWMSEPGMTAGRASNILESRNVAGVIVGPMPHGLDELNLVWDKFCSVRIGYSIRNTNLTTIVTDHFSNMRMVYERLRSHGFRRIGFACPADLDDRVNRHWSGSFFAMQSRETEANRVPAFLDPEMHGSPQAFTDWYHQNRPEVIISGGARNYYNFLNEAGIAVPAEVQLVSIHTDGLAKGLSGISQSGVTVGKVSIDHLVGSIHRYKAGIETHPKTVLVSGEWQDGESYNGRAQPPLPAIPASA